MSVKTSPTLDSSSIEADELLSLVTYKIARVHAKLNAQATHVLRNHAGLSLLEWRIITLLIAFGPKVPSVEIINQMQMDKGLFSRTLKGLVANDFVKVETDTGDQRRTLLSITAKGKDMRRNFAPVMHKRQEHLLHDITDTEKAALLRALEKLGNNAQRRDF